MRGFHILPATRTLGFSDGRKVRLGVKMQAQMGRFGGEYPIVGYCGMHAAPSIDGALNYFSRPLKEEVWVCYVEVSGAICDQSLVFCGKYRKVLSWIKVRVSLGELPRCRYRYAVGGKECTQTQLAKLLRKKAARRNL